MSATATRPRLHRRYVGPADAPTVVLLHGIMGHNREWDVLADGLADRFHVVAVDQRGHGRSPWADEYTASAMADDVEALVDDLGVPSVRLVGHSMGGMVSLLVAARRPELVQQLVVIDVGPESLAGPFAAELPGWIRSLGEATYPSVDAAVAEWAAGDPLAQEDHLRRYVEHCLVSGPDGLTWCFDAAGLPAFVESGVSAEELWTAVDRIACPTLVVRGEHSPVFDRAAAEAMVARLRSATLAEIAGGGHDLGVQRPEAVTAVVAGFLDGSRSGDGFMTASGR